MDLELFQHRLALLVEECGGRLVTSPQMTLRETRNQRFIPTGGLSASDAVCVVRGVQPFRIDITVEAERVGNWHHVSGDDRRMHPDLRQSPAEPTNSSSTGC